MICGFVCICIYLYSYLIVEMSNWQQILNVLFLVRDSEALFLVPYLSPAFGVLFFSSPFSRDIVILVPYLGAFLGRVFYYPNYRASLTYFIGARFSGFFCACFRH